MNLSPLDGRYASRVSDLAPICSEYGLMAYRTFVEGQWLLHLIQNGICEPMSPLATSTLQQHIDHFSPEDYDRIKTIEKTTNHDVKAVEMALRDFVPKSHWSWIHFACTSEDINNTAYGLMIRESRMVVSRMLDEVLQTLTVFAKEWKAVPMLSLTHGQTATPTTLGKEIAVFVHRLNGLKKTLDAIPVTAKINGATGTFSAHVAALPDVNWDAVSTSFIIEKLGLEPNPLTAQIEPHDHQAQVMLQMSLIGNVLIDLCRDVWGYISRGYFGQKVVKGEVGSSTMPHKVNPIDFENAEGNMKLMRGIAMTLATELPISRFQRDLTDSTLQRNFGLVFGHFQLALKSLAKGLGKLELREAVLLQDLEQAPEVLTEAVQTVLRAHGHADAYDQLKTFSRGQKLTLAQVREFVTQTSLPEDVKGRLNALTAATYTGIAEQLVDQYLS